MSAATIIHGDCLDVLRGMETGSVDAVVTDPPYGLAFMGKRWDYDVPGAEVFAECLRVLVPGGRLLCFASTRTMHRMWCNIEDAGFTIEDSICWLYGSGFPKHGSKLKPAYEPVCVARKGAASLLNVDACRVGIAPDDDIYAKNPHTIGTIGANGIYGSGTPTAYTVPAGRWPANVIHDGSEEVLEAFAAFGDRPSRSVDVPCVSPGYHGGGQGSPRTQYGNDTGTAARFFYCAKASRSEREAGLQGMDARPVRRNGEQGQGPLPQQTPRTETAQRNTHPTVKPVALMRHLCRLVTPPGGLVLDPFAGSGTTGCACVHESFRFIGVEREAEYVAIARRRIADAQGTPAPAPDAA